MLGGKVCGLGLGANALLSAALCTGILNAQTPQYRVEGKRSYYEYYIYPGDVLRISVYQHSELSKTVAVTSSGEINLPWLNATKVAGLSLRAASDLLTQKVQSVVEGPCVTITVRSRKGPWVLKEVPFFIDVPPPSHYYAKQTLDS